MPRWTGCRQLGHSHQCMACTASNIFSCDAAVVACVQDDAAGGGGLKEVIDKVRQAAHCCGRWFT